MKNKKIIAIIGMAGTGKTATVDYLQKKYSWPKIYFGDVIFDEMKKKKIKINWKNERTTRENLRKKYGMGAMAILSLSKVKKTLEKNNIVLIESLYSWDEYKIIKKTFGKKFSTLAIFTPRKLRAERLKKRKIRPIKTRKEFNKRDYTEIEGTDKGGPIAIADYIIINDSTINNLHKNIIKIIDKIIK